MSRAFGLLVSLSVSLVLLGLLGAGPASAHTDLVGAVPAAGTAPERAPADLTLTFTSPLVSEGTQIVVRDPRGVDHAGTPAVSGTLARVPLSGLSRPGAYTVVFRVVAGDGHPVTGRYEFRVTRQAAQGARAARPSTASAGSAPVEEGAISAAGGPVPHPSSDRWVVGGLGAASLVALLLVGARRRSVHDEELAP